MSSDALDELRRRFLAPSDENRTELTALIEEIFAALPSATANEPFVGSPAEDPDWLGAFETIPSEVGVRSRALAGVAAALRGAVRWHSPAALLNVTPPVMMEAAAIAAVASLYNPNCLWDATSGAVLAYEDQIVRQMARLCRWEATTADGAFTFGGKGCLVYALRIGLNRSLAHVSTRGLAGQLRQPVVIASGEGHYSIESACALIGLGTDSCRRVRALPDETMDLAHFAEVLESTLTERRPLACIVLSGGNTLSNAVDPLRQAMATVDAAVVRHRLPYRPFVHFDTVVGWPWLCFADYDFACNPLAIDGEALASIRITMERLLAVEAADSMGIDFHKTGLAPYSSSLFLTRDGAELHSINRDTVARRARQRPGENFRQHHTIEHSRSAAPILSAWVVLQSAGRAGLQAYVGALTAVALRLRCLLIDSGFELLNPHARGFASVFWPRMPGVDAYRDLLDAGPEAIEGANRYTYAFVEALARGRSSEHKLLVGYVPYRASLSGIPVGALRIYPMSPHHDADSATALARHLADAKRAFDAAWSAVSPSRAAGPMHVPV
jgi:L-2,4-diaminobutyrate decarboxylase